MNWLTSPEYKQDAEFLWHCWWLPNRFLSRDYAKGVAALIGWHEPYRKQRFSFWNNQNLAEVSHDGGLEAQVDVFELFQSSGNVWKQDRADALQNLVLLLHQNIERQHLVPHYCRKEWLQKIIWHWQRLHERNLVRCKAEANALHAAATHLKSLREAA